MMRIPRMSGYCAAGTGAVKFLLPRALSRNTVLGSICPSRCQLTRVAGALQVLDQVGELEDARHGQAQRLFDFLNRRQLSRAALLPIEREHDADRLRARRSDDVDGLTNCGACSDNVVDDEY